MITIHKICPSDREQLVRLCNLQKNFNAQEIEVAIEVIDDALNPVKHDYHILTAQSAKGQVMGFICYGTIPLTKNRFDIYWIVVEPAHARQGIGIQLLRETEKRLKAHSPAYIYVETSSTPGYKSARSFYEKSGYIIAATLANFYRDGDDKVIYLKRI